MSRHAQETGFTATGDINMGGSHQITNLAAGDDAGDAINKGQLDIMVPIGGITMFAGSTGYDTNVWQLCDGSAISRTTYATLFARLGTTHGAGNGSTTFNVPDLRGRFIAGSGQGSGLTNRVLGAEGGAETVTLTEAQMPSHNHTGTSGSAGSHSHTLTATTGNESANHTHTTTITTGNQSANHTHTGSGTATDGGDHSHGGATGGAVPEPLGLISWDQQNYYQGNGGYTAVRAITNRGGAHSHSITSSGNHTHPVSITTGNQSANHTHTGTGTSGTQSATHTHTITDATTSTASAHTHSIPSAGSGSAHDNIPPFYVLTFLIRKA